MLAFVLLGLMVAPVEDLPDLRISELMASNSGTLADEDGEFSDWIELHNAGAEAVDLAGYTLSDDLDAMQKWVIPSVVLSPGARLVVFASGKDRAGDTLHTSFKLSSDGEAVALADPSGVLVDSVTFGALPRDISYGRAASDPALWRVFDAPTPGRTNSDGFLGIVEAPVLGTLDGRYSGPVSASASSQSDAVVRYTLDGSVPTPDDPELASPVVISTTGVFRARAFRPDHIASSVATATYLIDEPTTLPVFALVVDPDDLWSRERGIYNTFNQYKPYEAPVHLALLEAGQPAFTIEGGVRIHGGYSRRYPQKSLAVFARGRYGADAIAHRLFPDLPHSEFQAFVLRNSGQDWYDTLLRDGLMQTLVEETAIDDLEYRPTVVYLNGAYWGLHNLREKPNEHYLARHHGVDPDDIDLLEFVWGVPEPGVIHGDEAHYDALVDYVTSHGVTSEPDLEYVAARVDLDNFIDYHVAQIYFNNADWPGNNVKMWRPRTDEGRWRWVLFDTDTGFGLLGNADYGANTLAHATDPEGSTYTNLPETTVLFRSLLGYEGFRHRFVNRFADLLNGPFSPARVIAQIDSLAHGIEAEIPRQQQRWPDSGRTWQAGLDRMQTFAEERPAFVRTHLREAFGLGEVASVTVDVEGRGGVQVDRLEPSAFPWTGSYFAGVSIRLTAVPLPGWRFAGWAHGPTEASVQVDPGTLSTLTATFERGPRATTVVINEIQYNPPDDFDTEDWVELVNPTSTPIDVGGWVFSDDDDTHRFTIPAATTLDPGAFLVLCRDAAAFGTAYPNAAPCLGDVDFGLSGGGDQVRLFDASGALVDSLEYDDTSPWPTEAGGDGATLELLSPDIDNALAASWRASGLVGGTPGAHNSVTVDVEAPRPTPELALEPGVPNPFRERVSLRYTVPAPGHVSLRVFDTLGREVARLVDGRTEAGPHTATLQADGMPSGVYLVRLDTAQGGRTQTLTLVR